MRRAEDSDPPCCVIDSSTCRKKKKDGWVVRLPYKEESSKATPEQLEWVRGRQKKGVSFCILVISCGQKKKKKKNITQMKQKSLLGDEGQEKQEAVRGPLQEMWCHATGSLIRGDATCWDTHLAEGRPSCGRHCVKWAWGVAGVHLCTWRTKTERQMW